MGEGRGRPVVPVTLNSDFNSTTSPQTVLEVCAQLPKTVPGTVVTAIVAGVVLVLVKLLNEKLHGRLPLPIPGELLTVRMPGDGGQGKGQVRVDLASILPQGI